MHACHLTTNSAQALSRESSSEASSGDASSEDSEDERVQHLAKLQEQVAVYDASVDGSQAASQWCTACRVTAVMFRSPNAIYSFSCIT
jgi:hypothetical protein